MNILPTDANTYALIIVIPQLLQQFQVFHREVCLVLSIFFEALRHVSLCQWHQISLHPVCSLLDCALLQPDLDALSSRSTHWKLMFNETKCSLLSIGSRHTSSEPSDHQYTINGISVSSSQQKDLGIISSNLSWTHHISKIVSNAYEVLCLLRRSFCSSNNTITKKRLYISLVRSQLLYGSQIWRPCSWKT